jgi:hypothetical protein
VHAGRDLNNEVVVGVVGKCELTVADREAAPPPAVVGPNKVVRAWVSLAVYRNVRESVSKFSLTGTSGARCDGRACCIRSPLVL